MKQTIIIHGRPDSEEFTDSNISSPSNAHWFPWLQKQLIMKGELCQALEFPFKNEEPIYSEWVAVLENFKIDSSTTLIGHSCGAGFLVRFLSENPNVSPAKVFLVAPWLDPKKSLSTQFFNFEINFDFTKRVQVHVLNSTNDMQSILDSVEILKSRSSDIIWHNYSDKEHFCSPEFPELLELLK